jgi:biotin transport system substrate-specific component
VVLVGFVLGPALGFSALVLYLAEGAVGVPVFSPQGLGGLSQLLGPTGGFLLATPIAAAAAGFGVSVARTARFKFPVAILAGTMATGIVLAMGASWLAHLLNVSSGVAWHMAVVPFLPGECLKIATAAALYSLLRQWRRS